MSAAPTAEDATSAPAETVTTSSESAPAPDPAPTHDHRPEDIVQDNSWVILLFGDGERRLVRVRRGTKTYAGKQQVLVDPLLGSPYGANFRIEPRTGLVRDCRTVEEISGSVGDAFAAVVDAKEDASNAELFDDGAAQRLGEADIRRLKQKGLHGAELVKTIAANSSTFAGKTAFAQDKYLRKKAKKHMPHMSVLRPSPLTLCDFYMHKGPEKLLQLRRDTLGLMLTMSDVQPQSRVLVLDGMMGLLVGTTCRQLGGEGKVLAANVGKSSLDCVSYLNLPPAHSAVLRSCNLADLLAQPPLSESASLGGEASTATEHVAADAAGDAPAEAAPAAACISAPVEAPLPVPGTTPAAAPMELTDPAKSEDGCDASTTALATPTDGASSSYAAGGRATDPAATGNSRADGGSRKSSNFLKGEALAEYAAEGSTNLIVALKESPAPAIVPLLARLVPGSPFVIYHPSMQPLAECLHICYQAKIAVRLQLFDSWTRKYQVAPNRTHPEMNAYPPTGYVLCGITVTPPA